uniref:Uncharacterized protein n=1 Tax=Anguilla anguilla TaxID=7936 RepID=A0A0E9RPK0_ANGAN
MWIDMMYNLEKGPLEEDKLLKICCKSCKTLLVSFKTFQYILNGLNVNNSLQQ